MESPPLGQDNFISKYLTCMQTNLNGLWTIPNLSRRGKVLRPHPRHKHLSLALKRFDIFLVGLQEHHVPKPPARTKDDIVHSKLQVVPKMQVVLPHRWVTLDDLYLRVAVTNPSQTTISIAVGHRANR